MHNNLLKNSEGYTDWTAYQAMRNVIKEEKTMDVMRGDIFEYDMKNGTSLALVVSADYRHESKFQNVIILIDEKKTESCIPVMTLNGIMYANCERVSFGTTDKFGRYLRSVKAEEMKAVDEEMAKCLGLNQVIIERKIEIPAKNTDEKVEVKAEMQAEFLTELIETRTKAKIYEKLYKDLLEELKK